MVSKRVAWAASHLEWTRTCVGYGALLELALVQFAMHRATARGFHPVLTPDIVQRDVAEAYVPALGACLAPPRGVTDSSSVRAGRMRSLGRCGYQPRGEASQVYSIESTPGAAVRLLRWLCPCLARCVD